jgi:hypothetical protein
MPSPILYEGYYDGAFIVSMANGGISMDPGILDNSTGSDVLYSGGLVVVQAAAGVVTATHSGNTGNGTIGSVSAGANSEFGAYEVLMTSATAFNLIAPSGDTVGSGVTGTAFVGQVNFTLTAGGTAFVAGDSFTLTVSEQTGAWQSWTGGSITTAIGILYNRVWVEAGDFAKVSIVRRNCEVNQAELQFDPAVTGSGSYATLVTTALAALALNNVIAR